MTTTVFSVAWRNDFGFIINGLTNGMGRDGVISWVGHIDSGVGILHDVEGRARCLCFFRITIYVVACMRWFSSAADLQHQGVEGSSALSPILGLDKDEIASPRG